MPLSCHCHAILCVFWSCACVYACDVSLEIWSETGIVCALLHWNGNVTFDGLGLCPPWKENETPHALCFLNGNEDIVVSGRLFLFSLVAVMTGIFSLSSSLPFPFPKDPRLGSPQALHHPLPPPSLPAPSFSTQ